MGTDIGFGGAAPAQGGADRGRRGIAAAAVVFVIRSVYQPISRNLWRRTCRFTPTCSEYAAQAIEKHGVVKGACISAWRILRCNPFSQGGDDPVR